MSDSVTVYGISNCDTIKKAKSWLDKEGVQYRFHDYRKHGVDKQLLIEWTDKLGWEPLLNKRGTTWRKLSDEVKQNIDQVSAIDIMLENPAIIKRPLLVKGAEYHLGFSATQYQDLFA